MKSLNFTQTTPSASWTINHGFGQMVAADTWVNDIEDGTQAILPTRVVVVNPNTLRVDFSSPRTGGVRVVAMGKTYNFTPPSYDLVAVNSTLPGGNTGGNGGDDGDDDGALTTSTGGTHSAGTGGATGEPITYKPPVAGTGFVPFFVHSNFDTNAASVNGLKPEETSTEMAASSFADYSDYYAPGAISRIEDGKLVMPPMGIVAYQNSNYSPFNVNMNGGISIKFKVDMDPAGTGRSNILTAFGSTNISISTHGTNGNDFDKKIRVLVYSYAAGTNLVQAWAVLTSGVVNYKNRAIEVVIEANRIRVIADNVVIMDQVPPFTIRLSSAETQAFMYLQYDYTASVIGEPELGFNTQTVKFDYIRIDPFTTVTEVPVLTGRGLVSLWRDEFDTDTNIIDHKPNETLVDLTGKTTAYQASRSQQYISDGTTNSILPIDWQFATGVSIGADLAPLGSKLRFEWIVDDAGDGALIQHSFGINSIASNPGGQNDPLVRVAGNSDGGYFVTVAEYAQSLGRYVQNGQRSFLNFVEIDGATNTFEYDFMGFTGTNVPMPQVLGTDVTVRFYNQGLPMDRFEIFRVFPA